MLSLFTFSALFYVMFGWSRMALARPIPQTVTMFRRAFFNAKDDVLIVQNGNVPASWNAQALEPYDQYHFRYQAIGCPDVAKNETFFDTCCRPRSVKKIDDKNYPPVCNLPAYLIFNPVYLKDRVVAHLGVPAKNLSMSSVSSASTISSTSTISSKGSFNFSSVTPDFKSSPAASSLNSQTSSSKWSSSITRSSSVETPYPTWSSSRMKANPMYASSTSKSSTTWTPSSTSQTLTSSPSHVKPAAAYARPSSSSDNGSSKTSSTWSSSSTPAYTPSSTWTPATSSAATGNSQQAYTGGQATWFTQNGDPGACGSTHNDYDLIVALDYQTYGNMNDASQYCGRSVTITNTDTGAQITATVADACPGCSNSASLDCSLGTFQALGPLSEGVIPISWHFN